MDRRLVYCSLLPHREDSIPLEPAVSTMIFIAKVRGLSTICKVMPISTHIVFMPGII
jgi:hypothetical protein